MSRRTLLAAFALVAFLAACGGGTESVSPVPVPPEDAGADPVVDPAAAPPPADPVSDGPAVGPADGPVADAGGQPFRTAAQCGACHKAIYAEWQASMHGQAMVDPIFLRIPVTNKEECIRCHAPVPLREVEFDTPIARLDRRDDAVSCLTCHQYGDGVAGPSEGLSGACRPMYDPAQTDAVKMCFGCHNQHDTGTEWLSGPYGPEASAPREKDLKTCFDCHMPVVERPLVEGGPIRKGRRHTWPGGHDYSQILKAAEIDVEVETLKDGGFRFRIWVTNVGAGHNIPTDARHRSFDTYVKLWDDAGNVILDPLDFTQQAAARAATYRKFYRNSGVRDTQIGPLERVSGIEAERGYIDWPAAVSGRGEAWLVYRLTPEDMLEEESITQPETLVIDRARLVKRVEFTYGK